MLSVGVLLASGMSACAQQQTPAPSRYAHGTLVSLEGAWSPRQELIGGEEAAGPIVLDGDIGEWPSDSAVVADENYLYFRLTVQGQQYPLQAAPYSVTLFIDADATAETGVPVKHGGAVIPRFGADVKIVFSPKQEGSRSSNLGVAAFTMSRDGAEQRVGIEDLGLTCAPTYAAAWYEGRIARHLPSVTTLPESGLRTSGEVRVVFATIADDGRVTGASDPASVTCGPAAGTPIRVDASLPKKPQGAIRVISYNVERSKPIAKPDTFQRIFRALEPDVILLQEWEEGGAAAVEGWFTALVPINSPWHVLKAPGDNSNGGGVAIVSRFPMEPLIALQVVAPNSAVGNETRPVRFIGAVAQTPMGEAVFASIHLKSRGTKDSVEDRRRMSESRAINAAVLGANRRNTVVRVIGGDMNLVGTRPPLDLLRAGLDTDGSDLTVAEPMVLGDRVQTTWRDASTPFPPGRLDYLMYSDATCEVVNAFVLDTALWSDAALARVGFDRTDSGGSDHLPVVLDLRAAKKK